MSTHAVTVRGAGIFGLSVAFACVRRGAKVTLVDPGGPGAGASGGIVGALSPHTPENWNDKKAFQFESLEMAGPFWAEVERLSGKPSGFGRMGRLQPLIDDRAVDLAHARRAGARDFWQGRYDWRVVKASDHAHFAPSPTGHFTHDTLSARLHPCKACDALAGALESLGARIVAECETDGIEVQATGVAGLDALSREAGKQVGTGVKGQAALFDLDLGNMPTLYADGVYIVPHDDGTVAVGSTSEREFSDPVGTDAQLEDLIETAVTHCPALGTARRISTWAGVRPRARSRAPMLGRWPGKPDVYIANGGFKIGFGMAPKVGEVMADLILDGVDTIPESFRVEANL